MMQLEQQIIQSTGSAVGSLGSYPSADEPICCLLDAGVRCQRPAGNASYNKQVRNVVLQKKLTLTNDPQTRHIYICDYHKVVILVARSKHQSKDTDDDSDDDSDLPRVDFFQLPVSTLRRYKKYYKVPTKPGLNKAQLAEIMYKHFKFIPIDEKEIITYFIYTVKTNANRLENKNGIHSDII